MTRGIIATIVVLILASLNVMILLLALSVWSDMASPSCLALLQLRLDVSVPTMYVDRSCRTFHLQLEDARHFYRGLSCLDLPAGCEIVNGALEGMIPLRGGE
jgi:hypothetical protein